MNKEWITKYIVGEMNAAERATMEAWIEADPVHKEEYIAMKKVWELSAQKGDAPEIDIDRAWNTFTQLRTERAQSKDEVVVKIRTSRSPFRWIGAAAAILLILGLSYWGLNDKLSQETDLRTLTQTLRAPLPDGSMVSLNKDTELHYHKSWFGKKRAVSLVEGEAFFEVKKDKAHPFVIEAGQHRITVVGTSFHVRRTPGETEVIVATGKVRVNYGDQEVFLLPEQRIVIADTSKQTVKVDSVKDNLYRYYVHQVFEFDNTPLSRVFEALGKAYEKEFVLENPAHRKLLYSAKFEQQGLSEMIDVILKTFDLKMKKRGNKYYIN
ncbi:FecR family protein [Sphingobacterium psychroaquaticum]|uniref:FecR family protein n=1 Tax=Sphingobacterium psychroaquaticum TaxID=561061 RepID=A0A1X7I5J5_9SPHI|nr:FecR family protein [Sphingobacterium psychroaquaticum]SMG09061.1 FecR family protein [Sphingobacterium psychroaquaticum]